MHHKLLLLFIVLVPALAMGQNKKSANHSQETGQVQTKYTTATHRLTLEAAIVLTNLARSTASSLDKDVSIAIVDASGELIMLTKGDGVGPHNTEAARRKAYTAVSTKTPTLLLARNARVNADTENLASLPELLLLGGGHPIWYNGQVIGGIGVAGGGGPENDHTIAKSAAMKDAALIIH